MFNILALHVRTFTDINQAYLSEGSIKVPSEDDLKKIKADLAAMSATGRLSIGGGALGLGVTYFISGVPYVGPLLGLITGITSVAAGVIGFDLQTSSNNLQEYSKKTIKYVVSTVWDIVDGDQKMEKKQFNKILLYTASENTILIRMLFDITVAHQI